MKKNFIQYSAALLLMALTFSGCDDFFNPETDNVLDHGDYINEPSEIYSGYIGLMTQMQKIGDKIIYLTDTRGELLEPTVNAPTELFALYNYDQDLTGNAYADPAPYYDVVIACNDYLMKLYEYKKTNPASLDKSHYEGLVSGTLRIKAWTYLTIAKIYGKAVWFDDPMRELKDLSQFEVKKLEDVVRSCIDLIERGFDGVNGSVDFSWVEWLDPHTNLADNPYRYWDYTTPEYFALYAELLLWNGDYEKSSNLILNALNKMYASTNSDNTYWMRNYRYNAGWPNIWDGKDPLPQEVVSAIIYDYKNNQTNSLLKHFSSEYPNEFLLAPSEVGRARFADEEFNPLGSATTDKREGFTFARDSESRYFIRKFRPINSSNRPNPYQDDVQIYIYRGADLLFMLAEAMNNLGRFDEASALINHGVAGTFPNGGVTWKGFTDDWTSLTTTGSRKYPDIGIRGVFDLGVREFYSDIKENDLAILDEMMLEFACEGRIYPAMIRMAMRHNDYSLIADRVAPKYDNPGEITAKILAGGYFVNWDLGSN